MKSEMWFTLSPDIVIEGVEGQALVYLYEGTGDNLLPEDKAEGYVDYLNYDLYDLDPETGKCKERDGGMVMLKEYVSDLSEPQALALLSEEIGSADNPIRIKPENITEIDPLSLTGLNI